MTLLAKILGAALVVAALAVAVGAAASLALGSRSLSAGSLAVSSCGVSSLGATRSVDNSGNVTQVSVTGIPAACSGETLSMAVVNAANAALATASTTLGGCTTTCSATFTGLGAVSAASVSGYRFALAGP
jgi:uncharacterized Zn-binding protein involved in type VI secretion